MPSKDSGDDVGFKLLKENEMLQQKWVLAGKLKKKNESRKEIRTEAGGVNRIECFTCFPLKMKES